MSDVQRQNYICMEDEFNLWLVKFLDENDVSMEELSIWDLEQLYDIFLKDRT